MSTDVDFSGVSGVRSQHLQTVEIMMDKPGMGLTNTNSKPKTRYEFIAQPLQLSNTCVFESSFRRVKDDNEGKEIASPYLDGAEDLDTQLGLDMSEEIVEAENILIDEIAFSDTHTPIPYTKTSHHLTSYTDTPQTSHPLISFSDTPQTSLSLIRLSDTPQTSHLLISDTPQTSHPLISFSDTPQTSHPLISFSDTPQTSHPLISFSNTTQTSHPLISYTDTSQTSHPLSLHSFLDGIPDKSGYVDAGNVQLYLECSDDNESSSHEYLVRHNRVNTEATSQIKMDTRFKISFPSVPEITVKCSVCNLLFLSKNFLREHTIIKHSRQFHFCKICSYFTKSFKFYRTHVQTRHKQCTPIERDHAHALTVWESGNKIGCNSKETDFDENVNITVDNENGKESGCVEIGKKKGCKVNKPCLPANALEASTCHGKRNNGCCEICGFVTKSNRLLRYHKQNMHNKERITFQCSICEYTCLQRRSFLSHLKRHSGVNEFQCNLCTKKFVSKHLLTKHSRKHRAKSIQVSGINGTYSIYVRDHSTQTKLTRTNVNKISNNSEDKPCTKSKKSKAKKFKCSFDNCNNVFRDSFNLKKHLAVHSKSFKCKICSFKGINMCELNDHVTIKHT